MFAVRKISASDLAKLRADAFAQFPGLQADWLQELEEAEEARKPFERRAELPAAARHESQPLQMLYAAGLGAEQCAGRDRAAAPRRAVRRPQRRQLARAVYARLRRHFQFVNELALFARGTPSDQIQHQHLRRRASRAALYFSWPTCLHPLRSMPATSMTAPARWVATKTRPGNGIPAATVTASCAWTRPRWLPLPSSTTRPGTPARRARLPALRAGALSSVLAKLAAYPRPACRCGRGLLFHPALG